MATPADNLQRIADLASEVRDFTYNSSNSLSFIDTGISDLTQEIIRSFANTQGTLVNIYGKLIEILEAIKKINAPKQEKKKVEAEEKKKVEAEEKKKVGTDKKDKSKKKADTSKIEDAGSSIKKMTEGAAGSFFKYIGEAEAGFAILSEGMVTAAAGMTAVATAAAGLAIGFLAAGVAVAAAPKMLMNLIDQISPFVKALDPALMAQLSLAISDLMATIGVGLRPVIQAAIKIIRTFADVFVPIMNDISSVSKQFGNAMMKIAVPVIAIWASAINYLISVIESVVPFFLDLAEILSFLTPAFTLLFDVLSRSMNLIMGVFHGFMLAIKTLTVAVLDAAAWITSWVSKSSADSLKKMSDDVAASAARSADEMSKSFGRVVVPARKVKEPGSSLGMAAKQASYSGIADLGKSMMQAAFGQSAQTAAVETADNTREMKDGIKYLVGWFTGQGKDNKKQQGVRN